MSCPYCFRSHCHNLDHLAMADDRNALDQKVVDALPPSDLAMQPADRTEFSVKFVLDAELYLHRLVPPPRNEVDLLQRTIDMIKRGKLVMNCFISVEQYLADNLHPENH